jgi:hypothetical protein
VLKQLELSDRRQPAADLRRRDESPVPHAAIWDPGATSPAGRAPSPSPVPKNRPDPRPGPDRLPVRRGRSGRPRARRWGGRPRRPAAPHPPPARIVPTTPRARGAAMNEPDLVSGGVPGVRDTFGLESRLSGKRQPPGDQGPHHGRTPGERRGVSCSSPTMGTESRSGPGPAIMSSPLTSRSRCGSSRRSQPPARRTGGATACPSPRVDDVAG